MPKFKGNRFQPQCFEDEYYNMPKNSIYKITTQDNDKKFRFYEPDTNETSTIQIKLKDRNNQDYIEYSILGRECKPQFFDEIKATDILYIYLNQSASYAHIYVYDMKKTIGGIDNTEHLLAQWSDTIQYCENILSYYISSNLIENIDITPGFLTENYNTALLETAINELKVKTVEHKNEELPTLIIQKHKVANITSKQKLKIFCNFRDKKLERNGRIYTIDDKYFNENKQCELLFYSEVDI